MKFLKNNPVGIDVAINTIQNRLFDKLTVKWGIDLDAYPRCYIIEKRGIKSIEHFKGKNEYSGNLIVAEKNKFYFLAENDQKQSNFTQSSTTINLFFILKLSDIYPNILHRCDSEIISDIVSELSKTPYVNPEMSIITDFKKIFQGFKSDMNNNVQPYLCLRIDCTISNYKINERLC